MALSAAAKTIRQDVSAKASQDFSGESAVSANALAEQAKALTEQAEAMTRQAEALTNLAKALESSDKGLGRMLDAFENTTLTESKTKGMVITVSRNEDGFVNQYRVILE